MISRCAHDWPYDIIRSKCEQPVTTLRNASDIARYLPAIKYDLVFRNHFCALCNRIKGDFEYFPLKIKTNILPPKRYSFEKKINFLLIHGAEFPRSGPQKPKTNQTRRYCLKPIVNSCQNDKRNDTCRNGPVSIISIFGQHYKNYECALCNNPLGPYQCFPDLLNQVCMLTSPQKFTLNLDYGNITSKLALHRSCSGYDVRLEECVQVLPIPTGNKDSFRILTWLSPSANDRFNKNDFKGIMNQYYGIESSQIQNISIQTVLRVFGLPSYSGTPILYHLVHSTIVLTPEQSFNIYYNASSSSRNLQEFIYFKQSNAITWNNITYTIIKTTSRPLSCVGKKIYNQRSYTVIDDDKIKINSTGKTYERSQYYGDIGNNVVVCEEYMPNGCQLTKVGLTKNDVTIYKNLALRVNNTRMFYNRGNYEVSNGLISLCKTRESSTPTCSTQMSCKGRCSNKTEWRNIVKMTCSCDPDCHKVFGDCCSDYTKYCGAQTSGETPRKTYNYTCENFGKYDSTFCPVADGVWMVSGCSYEWPRDSTRSKCETPIEELPQSSDILTDIFGYLPVISKDNTTFRNMYCAICNNEMEYNSWPLKFRSAVIPPETSNITKIIRFLEKYNARFGDHVGPIPATDQARRYCLRRIINKCPPGKEDPSCDYGNVNLVSFGSYHLYTNKRCAVCNGLSKDRVSVPQCFPNEIIMPCDRIFQPRSLSIVFGHTQGQNEVVRSVPIYDERCERNGLVYDDKLHVCRVNWLPSPEENGREIFYVLSWLQPSQIQFEISFTAMDFQNSLSKYLNMTREQFFDINITKVSGRRTPIIQFYIVETKIILTSQQSLQFLFNTINATEFDKRIREFIYFREEFSLQIKNLNYTIIKTTSRPLACVGKVTYTPEEYILQQNERVLIRSTNETLNIMNTTEKGKKT
ncbi:uncharacterized protein LOC124435327 [Xenia sp. Carnegie-2017]|uniref:uncharacterized protein LOC124435327 n=1 Tax=Xenia sp. Carnegie-2017 TaxID=2897299 RepID=UPI001F04086D|nr:uncharacterized protein LOC124435327 [Xenia sp. Carnegie-2017]